MASERIPGRQAAILVTAMTDDDDALLMLAGSLREAVSNAIDTYGARFDLVFSDLSTRVVPVEIVFDEDEGVMGVEGGRD